MTENQTPSSQDPDKTEEAPQAPTPAAATKSVASSSPESAPSAGPAQPEDAAPAEADEPAAPTVESVQEELGRMREQLLRTAADFDNFRKRSRRELVDAERQGREELLRELLPVFDNLERAAQHAQNATEAKAVADGVQLVIRQFLDTLGRIGIERISAVGTAFDPALHEAIQHLEDPDHPPGTVTNEVQPGYKMGDRLVRPAMVVVAKQPSSS